MKLTPHVQRFLADNRFADAMMLVEPLADADKPSYEALSLKAQILFAQGRVEEALGAYQRLAECFPTVGAAWHDLAAAHVNLRHGPEARAAAERAIGAGFEEPETWQLIGMASVIMGDAEGAEHAYGEVLRLRPTYIEVIEPLCEMIWTRTGDIDATLAPVRAARNDERPQVRLTLIEARRLMIADRTPDAIAFLEQIDAKSPDDPEILQMLGKLLLAEGKFDRAGLALERALAIEPDSAGILTELAAVRLAQGRADEALPLARQATELAPLDQSTWAYLASAARIAGDPEYGRLYDYDTLVRTYRLETPEGWPSLDAYLADLSGALRRLHARNVAPLEQTLKRGTQTLINLTLSEEPSIRAFFAAIETPIGQYLEEVGEGSDPVRSRKTGGFRVAGSWSVLLKSEGFHVNHIHPTGWLSSAFYVELPREAQRPDTHDGWLGFGEPQTPTEPPSPPERFVRPEAGMLVLFPSHMWHGTPPFASDDDRLAIAFDVVPAR